MKTFPGFSHPQYTQIPNDVFQLAPDMTEAELRVVLAIARLTFGFQYRPEVRRSLTAIQQDTGLSRKAVLAGARAAEEHGFLSRRREGQGVTIWEMRWAGNPGEPDMPGSPVAGVIGEPVLVSPGNHAGVPGQPPSMKETVKQTGKQTGGRKRARRRPSASLPAIVELHRRLTGRYLNKVVWPRLQRAVPGDFPSLLRYGRLLRSWVARGYNPTNVERILAAYAEGGLRSNGRPVDKTPAVAALDAWAEEAD